MAQGLTPFQGALLANSIGQLVGAVGPDGKEYLFPTVLNASAATALQTVAIAGGSINNTPIGAGGAGTGSFSTLRLAAAATVQQTLSDGTGTPGNVTQNAGHGRAAFAAAASTVVVTNSLVATSSSILVQLGGSDATLTSVRVTAAAASFTVTGNAAATGVTPFDYVVVNN